MLISSESARKEVFLTRAGIIWFLWLNIVYSLYLTMRYFFHEQSDIRSSQSLYIIALIFFVSVGNLILTIMISRNGHMVKRSALLGIVMLYAFSGDYNCIICVLAQAQANLSSYCLYF